MNFGDNLRTLIEENNMTQKELAKRLNVAPSTIGSYVQNAREPDFATLMAIADLFSVTTDYLLGHKAEHAGSLRENELLRIFRSLTAEQQDICTEQCRVFLRMNSREKTYAKSS